MNNWIERAELVGVGAFGYPRFGAREWKAAAASVGMADELHAAIVAWDQAERRVAPRMRAMQRDYDANRAGLTSEWQRDSSAYFRKYYPEYREILTESGAAYEVVREVKRRIWGILQTVAEVAA